MNHKTLLAATLAVLIAGSPALAIAQAAPPPAAGAMQGGRMTGPAMPWHGERHGPGMEHPGMWRHGDRDAHGGVIGYLRGLERLSMMSGRSKEMAAVYNEVLARSQDPRVRDYAYQHLARLQARPANVDQAIATMRKGLDESLSREAKRRAEMEKMRSAWMQRHGEAATPSTTK
ncbi:MAG: hypothetical protein KGM46_12075 [Pseudomonadota bacterium]|nr:hypothetical protein [Pseudomonadota bacterium]